MAEKPADLKDEPSQVSGSKRPSTWIDRLTLLLSHSRNESLWIKEWRPNHPEEKTTYEQDYERESRRRMLFTRTR